MGSTPNFEDTTVTENDVQAEQGTDETVSDLELEVNDDANLDVDIPVDDETEEVPAEGTTAEAKADKPAKTPRQKAPEGFVKPVEFAKLLSAHLGKTVPPQVVYSYIKNNSGAEAKNPFPTHTVGDYDMYVKPEEGLAWWDAKNARVSASKAAKAEKAAKKEAATPEAPTETAPVVEAE